jgi:hypothetical protein
MILPLKALFYVILKYSNKLLYGESIQASGSAWRIQLMLAITGMIFPS